MSPNFPFFGHGAFEKKKRKKLFSFKCVSRRMVFIFYVLFGNRVLRENELLKVDKNLKVSNYNRSKNFIKKTRINYKYYRINS